MTKEINFVEKPEHCPFCGAQHKDEWLSESGQSSFISYKCGLELANQSALSPRAYRRTINRHCANVYHVVLELKRIVS